MNTQQENRYNLFGFKYQKCNYTTAYFKMNVL